MNNISITPKGGTIASEVSGNQVNLTAPSVVKLHLNQADIKSFTRNGNDLVVTTKSGEVLVIHDFYTPNGDSDLVLEDDRGALWWVEDPGTEGFQYVSIDSTEGLLAANTTDNGTIAAFGIAGAALAGIGALVAGNNGGGGGGDDNGGGDNGGGDNGGGDNGGGDNGGGDNGGGDDTTPPAAVTDLLITGNAGNQPGTIANGSATADNTPTLSGTAEAGAIIRVYDGTTLIGSTTAGADGRWSFTPSALSEGQHSLSVTATDAAGNTSPASSAISFTVDTLAPAAATDLSMTDNTGGTTTPVPNGSTTDDNTPTLSGRGEAGATVSVYDGQTLLGTVVVGANGTWSFTTPVLSAGSHSLTATLTDAAGNVSAPSVPFVVSIVAELPPATSDLQIYDDSGNTAVQLGNGASTADTTPTLTGVTTAGSLITLYNGTTVLGSVVADGSGQWRFTPSALSDGSYNFSATVTDANGNVTQTPTITITIDTVAPVGAGDLNLSNGTGDTAVPITAGGVTNTTTPTLSGTAEPGSTITIRDGTTVIGTATADANGGWSFTTPVLSEGNHSLTTTVSDAAGNTGPASAPINFGVDVTPPAQAGGLQLIDNSGATPAPIVNGATNNPSPALSGTAEPNSTVTVSDGNTVLGTATADANGNWSFTPAAPLTEGDHSLTVVVTDPAGNASSASDPINFTVDITPPPAASGLVLSNDESGTPVPIGSGETTDDSTPVLSGTAEAGGTVQVYDGGELLGSATVNSDGSWSFTVPALANGAHSLTAVAIDAAGNRGDASPAVNFTVDAALPPATVSLEITDDSGNTVVKLADGDSTRDDTPTLAGLAPANSIVTLYDGDTLLGSVTADANGQWTYETGALADGTYNFSASINDNGTVTTSPTITITIDTLVPAAPAGLQLVNDQGETDCPSALAVQQTTRRQY
ncbi:Ig-like domain-containing protein [Pantoea wallisii]|uniref:Ig-like domain-containing protein n=1 Tax=Pantoea wallisii TaxID=1076551 RepID=UPI001FC96EB1|nr:Ig-like domain-containing protein [Pantoea wallisii]